MPVLMLMLMLKYDVFFNDVNMQNMSIWIAQLGIEPVQQKIERRAVELKVGNQCNSLYKRIKETLCQTDSVL